MSRRLPNCLKCDFASIRKVELLAPLAIILANVSRVEGLEIWLT